VDYEKVNLDEFKMLFSQKEYDTWITTLEDAYKKDNEIHLVAVNEFHKTILKNNYIKPIRKHFDGFNIIVDDGCKGINTNVIGILPGITEMFEKYNISETDAMKNIIADALLLAHEKGRKNR
jgi:hypothetical protein